MTGPRWRYRTTQGYVMIYAPEHPRADQRGYVYEHLIVAEAMIGRPLEPGEEVHHRNEIKWDNQPENLEVCATRRHHQFRHRTPGSRLRKPEEANPTIVCACGCGARMPHYDTLGRPRTYLRGHNRRSHGA